MFPSREKINRLWMNDAEQTTVEVERGQADEAT